MATRLTIALACGVLALAPGCGGDDEEAAGTDTTPRITVPNEDTTTPPATDTTPATPTRTAPAPQTTTPDSGGSTAPAKPDSPENDTKPAPNTPEQRFEEFCDQNPGACG